MNKMYFVAIATFVLAASCSDETTVFQETLKDDVILESSESILESSINYDMAGVLDIFEEGASSGKSSKCQKMAKRVTTR